MLVSFYIRRRIKNIPDPPIALDEKDPRLGVREDGYPDLECPLREDRENGNRRKICLLINAGGIVLTKMND